MQDAVTALSQGRTDEARAGFTRALRTSPEHPAAHYFLGRIAQDSGKSDEAMRHFERSAQSDPAFAPPRVDGGALLFSLGRLEIAGQWFRDAIARNPALPEAYNNLGSVLKEQGRVPEAIDCFRRAIELRPDYASAHSNLLFVLHYLPGMTQSRLKAEHQAWTARQAVPSTPSPASAPPRPGHTLSVGFVSADLYRHPVGVFLAPFALHHDRQRIRTVYYSDTTREDDLTRTIRSTAGIWRQTHGVSDDTLARQIAEDGIDVLVDLAGHTAGNRLRLFARRAAPVQASWIGYFNTTGIPAMDAILMDATTAPPGTDDAFCERVIRLSTRFCYLPPDYAPAVGAPPCGSTGSFAFGSFNNLAKLTHEVTGLWAEILRRTDDTRLILKWRSLADDGTRRRIEQAFAAHGIDAGRVVLRGWSGHRDSLAEYADVDLALDPFPFSGGLTSCDALYMGVPVLTWSGELPVSRQTAAILNAIGLEDFTCESREDFLRRAVAMASASAHARLVELRQTLRDRMLRSPLCDGRRHAAEVADALWALAHRV